MSVRPEPLHFAGLRRSPFRIGVLLVLDAAVLVVAVAAIANGASVSGAAAGLVVLGSATLAALYPVVSVGADGVRLRGLSRPLPGPPSRPST